MISSYLKIPLSIYIIFIGLLAVSEKVFAENYIEQYFSESEDTSKIIYRSVCFKYQQDWLCKLQAVQIRNEKSTFGCSLALYDDLIPLKKVNYQNNTWTTSSSSGVCGITNTYTISSQGMIQVKSSPKNFPEKIKDICEAPFPPKVYQMKSIDRVEAVLPIGDCKMLKVFFP